MSVYITDVNDSSIVNKTNSESTENEKEAPLDPRIQLELERLNKACADINKLENELEEAKALFISSKKRQTQRLEYLQKKLGSCINKAKPYYESLKQTEQLQIETQKAVHEFQKANSLYKTAKETLTVAENSLESNESGGQIPDEWQEHLSLIITKISLSKKAADQAEENHRNKALEFQNAEKRSQYLEKDLKGYILKSQSYYDEKTQWNIQMEAQKMQIHDLEQAIIQTKKTYKDAMLNLSKISEEIHSQRKLDKLMNERSMPNLNTKLYDNQSISNESQDSNYGFSRSKTFNEPIKTADSEYVSLGLNSTASNSRSSSPTNSIDNELELWKESGANDLNKQYKSKLIDSYDSSNNTSSFTNSTFSRDFTDIIQPQFFNHVGKTPQKQILPIDNLGISSLTLKSNESVTPQINKINNNHVNNTNSSNNSLTPSYKISRSSKKPSKEIGRAHV